MTRITTTWPIQLDPGSVVQIGDSKGVVANAYDDGVTYNLVEYSWISKVYWTIFGRYKCLRCGHPVSRRVARE